MAGKIFKKEKIRTWTSCTRIDAPHMSNIADAGRPASEFPPGVLFWSALLRRYVLTNLSTYCKRSLADADRELLLCQLGFG